MTLSELIKALPGVRPRAARNRLLVPIVEAIVAGHSQCQIGTYTLDLSDADELCFLNSRNSEVASPRGAELVVRLYMANALPLHSGLNPRSVPQKVVEYVESMSHLLAKADRRRTEDSTYHASLLDLPNLRGKLGWQLLEDVFHEHLGADPGELDIGGRLVTKTFKRGRSASSFNWHAYYTWRDPDGVERSVKRAG